MLNALLAAALVAGAAPVAAAAPSRPARPAVRPAAPPSATPPTLRLPATARPTRGAVELTIDPGAERYRGAVRYQVALGAPTTTLWLHAEELQVTGASLGGRPARPVTAPGGFLGLVVDGPAAAGEAELVVEFSGTFDRARWRGIPDRHRGGSLVRLRLSRDRHRASRLPLLRRAGLQDPLAPGAPGEAG